MSQIVYRLSTEELSYCQKIGTQRQTTNTQNNIRSKQFTKRDPTNIHIQGVIGEYTFGQICNREFKNQTHDLRKMLDNTDSRGSKQDTFDWNLFGKKIDVKTTLSSYAKNIYARYHKKTNPADYYVLIFIAFFDKASGRPVVAATKDYDNLLSHVLNHPDQYAVEGQFKGFTTHDKMFSESLQDGSYMAPIIPSFQDFFAQFSLPVSSSSSSSK